MTRSGRFPFLALLAAVAALMSQSATSAQPRAGKRIKDCRNCPELVVLPAGDFLMGSPPEEAERRENGKAAPCHLCPFISQ